MSGLQCFLVFLRCHFHCGNWKSVSRKLQFIQKLVENVIFTRFRNYFVTGLTTAICSVFAGIFLILDLSIFFRRKRTKHKWYFLNIGSDLSGSDFVGKLLNIEFSFRWLSVVTLLMFVYKILSITNIVQTLYKT